MSRSKALPLALAAAALLTPTLVANQAEAFCGFYVAPDDKPLTNDATMVALLREGTRTALSMSNNYKGPAADFAMVVPVPVVLQKDNVKVLDKGVFTRLEAISAPRLVEYWEQDPCNPYPPMPPPVMMAPAAAGGGMKNKGAGSAKDYGVTIEAKFEVGEYQILVLSAKQSDGLESWLHDNKYNIPKGASAALAPYIKEQWKFFVAKVDVKKVNLDGNGTAQLSPLRFHYESSDFRLPVRLGLLNAPSHDKQDLLLFVLSQHDRYEVANYPSVFIPTNLEVTDATRKSFGSFYAALFDAAVEKANGKGIVTEYSWTTPMFQSFGPKCDPCPPQPITSPSDLASLGADVVWGLGYKTPQKMGPTWSGATMQGNVVITRMHARYDATSLGDDLVFKTAPPVMGGREGPGAPKGNEHGASPAGQNNFQARYVIRHPWQGAIQCKNPQRNIWGGPPGSYSPPPPSAATGLAATPRAGIKYASFLKGGAPTFDVKSGGPTPPFVAPPSPSSSPEPETKPSEAGSATVADAAPPLSSIAPPAPSGSNTSSASPATVPSVQPQPHGCGCATPGSNTQTTSIAGLAAIVALVAVGARRSRRANAAPSPRD